MILEKTIAGLVLSASLSFVFSMLFIRFTSKYAFFLNSQERNFKEKKVPRGGGIAIFVSLGLSLLLLSLVFDSLLQGLNGNIDYPLLVFALLMIFLLGMYDDLKETAASIKLLFQTAAAVLVYFAGFKITMISIPFMGTKSLESDVLDFILTILWVVGITNAVNIMDGLDGLAVGVSFFAALSLGILALLSAQPGIVLLIAVLIGSMAGFYPFNFPKATIYLGDSGSLMIGFILAVLSMSRIHRKGSLALALIIPILILLLPILETLVTIVRRVFKKQNIFAADTDHFHFRFLKKGFSETRTTLLLILISFLFALTGILFEFVKTELRLMLLIFTAIVCSFLLYYLGYHTTFPRKEKPPGEE